MLLFGGVGGAGGGIMGGSGGAAETKMGLCLDAGPSPSRGAGGGRMGDVALAFVSVAVLKGNGRTGLGGNNACGGAAAIDQAGAVRTATGGTVVRGLQTTGKPPAATVLRHGWWW